MENITWILYEIFLANKKDSTDVLNTIPSHKND